MRETGLLGDGTQALDRVEHRRPETSWEMKPFMLSLAARESLGGGSPRAVLAGQHALAERRPHDLRDAFALAQSSRPGLGARHSIEYCGWLETKAPRPRAGATPHALGGHSLKPISAPCRRAPTR